MLVGALPPPVNGQSVAFRTLVDGVHAHGVPCDVVDLAGRDRQADGRGGVRRALGLVAPFVRHLRAVARGPCTVYLQIAQSRGGLARDVAFVAGAALFRRRVVVHLHGGNYATFHASLGRFGKAAARWVLGRAAVVVALSERLRGDFAGAVPPQRVVVVPNGLPGPLPTTLASPPADEVRLLYVSSLMPSKGYLDVVGAAARLRAQGVRVRVDLCGAFVADAPGNDPASLEAEFRRVVREGGLGDVVQWHGVVDEAEKSRLMGDANFFALPTAYVNEGLPVAIIEAMAHGLVVLAPDRRAIGDLVQDGVTGVVVPARDADALAAAVARLARDPEGCAAMGAAARRLVETRFTRERHVADLLAVLI